MLCSPCSRVVLPSQGCSASQNADFRRRTASASIVQVVKVGHRRRRAELFVIRHDRLIGQSFASKRPSPFEASRTVE
jgi:hypothetical protein